MNKHTAKKLFRQRTSAGHGVTLDGPGHNQTPASLESDVRSALNQCERALVDAEMRTRESQIIAISSLYRLFTWLEQHPVERADFYANRDITSDNRVRHPAQPLVKHFMTGAERASVLRSRMTTWAGAITEGIRHGVPADRFEDFIRNYDGGIDAAYRNACAALAGKAERGDRVDRFQQARVRYQSANPSVELPAIGDLDGLAAGSYLAVIEVGTDGKPRMSARLDRPTSAVESMLQEHILAWAEGDGQGSHERRVRARRRYQDAKPSVGKPIVLDPADPAAVEGRTRHTKLVRDPGPDEWVLKSGEHSRKLGSHVTKGRWRGFPVFSLSLEERATCPRSCQQWLSCYGNGMGQNRAYRYRHGIDLESQLERELSILNGEPKTSRGFVVRAHTLGDFYSVEYVEQWRRWLDQFPALHVFGFSAWQPDTEIGAAVHDLRESRWDRFAIRFSDGIEATRSAAVISHDQDWPSPEDGIVCPAERELTDTCGTCGLCWTTDRRIVFLEH